MDGWWMNGLMNGGFGMMNGWMDDEWMDRWWMDDERVDGKLPQSKYDNGKVY